MAAPGMEGSDVPTGGAEAGRRGSDVRSDCWVSVRQADPADVRLEIQSKVGALYGDSIRATVQETLEALGAYGIQLTLEDQGALPWVLAARVEAAVRRYWSLETGSGSGAGEGAEGEVGPGPGRSIPGDPRPPRTSPLPPDGGTARDRLRRSRLYLPGNEPKFTINAGLHRPDGVILDLEDSVHPNEKDTARLLVRNALRCVDFGGAERMVRINQLPLGLEDLDAVIPEAPEMILIPKVETAEQILEVAERIRTVRAAHGVTSRVWLMPILESALGVENAFSIAMASDTVAALTIGLEDYTADLGVVKTPEGAETHWARTRLVNAARAARVQAIDSVYGDVADEEGLLAWGRRARAMGFEGMGCIHPRQIRIIHRAFAPTELELEKALKIVAAFQEAEAKGL
ncbi:MAG: aldolase/citrate lyase family protein, partial [Longimicrobiales bacterium]